MGVEDKIWKAVGLKDYLPFDTKMLRDKIRKCSGLELDVDIVPHELNYNDQKLKFNLIYVRGSHRRTKMRMPSLAPCPSVEDCQS